MSGAHRRRKDASPPIANHAWIPDVRAVRPGSLSSAQPAGWRRHGPAGPTLRSETAETATELKPSSAGRLAQRQCVGPLLRGSSTLPPSCSSSSTSRWSSCTRGRRLFRRLGWFGFAEMIGCSIRGARRRAALRVAQRGAGMGLSRSGSRRARASAESNPRRSRSRSTEERGVRCTC